MDKIAVSGETKEDVLLGACEAVDAVDAAKIEFA